MLQLIHDTSLEELGYTNYGRVAYEGYCKSSDSKSLITGVELPKWENLDWKIQAAWQEAANTVGAKLRGYEDLPFCPNRSRNPGEARYSVGFTEEGFQEMLGIPWNHRLVSVEHDHGAGFVTAYYELVTPLITGYAGMDCTGFGSINYDTVTRN